MKAVAMGSLSLMLLTGCGEAAYLSYQGRPAETALECRAAYQEAQSRGANVSTGNTRGALIGAAIGRGLVKGATESAYNQCLARVSANPAAVGGILPRGAAPSPRVVSEQSGICAPGSGPFRGGSGYC